MGLVKKRGWSGVYPMTEGQQFPRVGLGDIVSSAIGGAAAASGPAAAIGTGIATSDWANCRGWSSYLNPGCYFARPQVVAPPAAPSGSVLTTPPASGEEAQATVDTLLNQQMADQQALAGSNVQGSAWDVLAGNLYAAGSAVGNTLSAPGGISLWVWLALGFGIFAFAYASPGRSRR